METLNSKEKFFCLMVSIIKLSIIYLLSKWYGLSGYIFLFLFQRIYYIIIYQIYNLEYISISDQINLLKEIFSSKIRTKLAILYEDEYEFFESLLKNIKDYNITNYDNFFKTFTYKWNNYYWRKLNKTEIQKAIIKGDNLDDKIYKKIKIKSEPLFQILILSKGKITIVILKYTYLINDLYAEQFIKAIRRTHIKTINEPSKILNLIVEFLLFPIQIFFDIIIIISFI